MASSTNTSAAASKDIFPFLSLPAELRNIIYEHLLIGGSEDTATHYAQILRTCRQVNQEASEMLYAENLVRMFISRSSKDVLIFKRSLLSASFPLQRVRKLEIHMRLGLSFWDYDATDARKVKEIVAGLCRRLAEHHSLTELTLRVSWSVPADFGPLYTEPELEEEILAVFTMLRNIPTVRIFAGTEPAFNTELEALMGRHEDQEDTV